MSKPIKVNKALFFAIVNDKASVIADLTPDTHWKEVEKLAIKHQSAAVLGMIDQLKEENRKYAEYLNG